MSLPGAVLGDRREVASTGFRALSPAGDVIGGGQMVAFSTANAATLAPYLGVADAAALIDWLRAQPIGAVIGSTPAILDAPSLDPPPDDDYGFPDSVGTFAGTYKDRRSMIFFGANDGMVHAVDARTGYEVWAFVPFNLLPKLRTLVDGQSVERFDYFVDSSPKIAEVKSRPGGRIEPLPEVKPYETFAYAAADQRSPFEAGVPASSTAPNALRPDVNRPREFLEQFSLDTLRMVGTLRLGGRNYGLIQTRDGLVHRVLPGNHLGQSDGRITAIEEGKISLTEIVPDGMGGFIERPAALALSE